MEQPVFRFLSHTQAIVSIAFGEQGETGGGVGGAGSLKPEPGAASACQGEKKWAKLLQAKFTTNLSWVDLGVVHGPPLLLFF